MSNSAQHSVQILADLGYAPRFQAFCVASGFFRFDSESTLPPQAATDNLQCQEHQKKEKLFCFWGKLRLTQQPFVSLWVSNAPLF